MVKPFTLKVQETEQEIVNILNKSEIPAFCLKQILQNLYKQLEDIDHQEIEKYNDGLHKKKESEK